MERLYPTLTKWIGNDWMNDNSGFETFAILTMSNDIIECDFNYLSLYDMKQVKCVYLVMNHNYFIWYNIAELVKQNILDYITVEEKLSIEDNRIYFTVEYGRNGVFNGYDKAVFDYIFRTNETIIEELFSEKYSKKSIAKLIVESFKYLLCDYSCVCNYASSSIDGELIHKEE